MPFSVQHYTTRLTNLLHSALLIGTMAVIASSIGWLVWGDAAVIWAAGMVAIGLAFSRNAPSNWILALLRAVPLSAAQWSEGYALIEELSGRAGLDQAPRLYYLPSPEPNAISVGRGRNSAIAVTQGLLQRLDERELAGVLAHEISHFRADDIGLLNLASLLSQLTFLMAFSGLLLVVLSLPIYLISGQTPPLLLILLLALAPHVVTLLTLALSRAREFDADRGAAMLTGDPGGLASALAKLKQLDGGYWGQLFPGRGRAAPWLQSHPGTGERIERLLSLRDD